MMPRHSAISGSLPARLFAASQPLRFLIVGGFNTLLCYLVYAGLVWAGVDYRVANFAAMIFGVCCNFVLQGRLVFNDHDPRRFLRFLAFWFAIYCAQIVVIGLLMRAGIGAQLAGLIVLPGTVVISYFIQKLFVFRSGGKA